MKKTKLTKRVSFLTAPEEFKEFVLKCVHFDFKYNTKLRELMKDETSRMRKLMKDDSKEK